MTDATLEEIVGEGVEVLRRLKAMPPRRLTGPALVEAMQDAADCDDARLDEIEAALRDHTDASAAVSRIVRLFLDGRIGEPASTERAAKLVRSTCPEAGQAQIAGIGARASEVLALAARRAVDARPERFSDGCDDLAAWDREAKAHMSSLSEREAAIREVVRLDDLQWTQPPPSRSLSDRDTPSKLVFRMAPGVEWRGDGGSWPRDLINAIASPPAPKPVPVTDPYSDEPDAPLRPMEQIADAATGHGAGIADEAARELA